MTESAWVNLIIVALVVAPVFSWTAAAILVRIALQRPYITGIVERAAGSVLKAFGSTLIALVILNSLFHWVTLPRPWTIGLIAISLFLLEFSSYVWLALYAARKFRGEA